MGTRSPLTDERDEIIRREWPLGTETGVIGQLLDACEGTPFPRKRIGQRASQLGVRRPPGFIAIPPKSAIAPAAKPPAPPKAAPPPPPVLAEPASPVPKVAPPSPPEPDFAPDDTGKVPVTFSQVMVWCQRRDIPFDGTNVDRVNIVRARVGQPPFILVG